MDDGDWRHPATCSSGSPLEKQAVRLVASPGPQPSTYHAVTDSSRPHNAGEEEELRARRYHCEEHGVI
jgi:hypothetical protein